MSREDRHVRTFSAWGFFERGASGNQIYGDCPFCAREGKFYLNPETGQWDCKGGACGRRGNVYTFLLQIWEVLRVGEEMFPWEALAVNRHIPVHRLREAGLAWDGEEAWILPVRTYSGDGLANLKRWVWPDPDRPRQGTAGRLLGTSGMPACLYGADQLNNPDIREVLVCEGEWDALAGQEMLLKAGIEGIAVVAVPGASIFRREWLSWFSGRDVVLAYDADDAGKQGSDRAADLLSQEARRLWVVDWGSVAPGFDLRDFFAAGGEWSDLQALRAERSTRERPPAAVPLGPGRPTGSRNKQYTYEQVRDVFQKWCRWDAEQDEMLQVCLAVAQSIRIPGKPLWVYLVGVPGSGKSLVLDSFRTSPSCAVMNTVTNKSLVSGFQGRDGRDPSLIPQLNGRTLVLRDFTELLKAPPAERDDTFAILRGAYDGEVSRVYGNGVQRHYRSTFAILAAVTRAIYRDSESSMGERFLKYPVSDLNIGSEAEEDLLHIAMNGLAEYEERASALELVCSEFLEKEVCLDELPGLDDWSERMLMDIARFAAGLRTEVAREKYSRELQFKPKREVATRLVNQLAKLGRCLAWVRNEKGVGVDVMRILWKIGRATAPDLCVAVLEAGMRSGQEWNTARELATVAGLEYETAWSRVQDLLQAEMFEIGGNKSSGGRPAALFRVNPTYRSMWENVEKNLAAK